MIIARQIVETWRPLKTVENHALQLFLRSTSVLFSSIITKRDDYKTKVKQKKVQGFHHVFEIQWTQISTAYICHQLINFSMDQNPRVFSNAWKTKISKIYGFQNFQYWFQLILNIFKCVFIHETKLNIKQKLIKWTWRCVFKWSTFWITFYVNWFFKPKIGWFDYYLHSMFISYF